jgi:hypothetical protein
MSNRAITPYMLGQVSEKRERKSADFLGAIVPHLPTLVGQVTPIRCREVEVAVRMRHVATREKATRLSRLGERGSGLCALRQPAHRTLLVLVRQTNKLPNEERNAIMYAWSLMGRAVTEVDEAFGLITSWVALEVLAKGEGAEIAGQLAHAYGADVKSTRQDLELERANRLRDLILYKGRRPAMGSRTFRLMQCYFIDLLRFRLGLSCMRATSSAIAEPGSQCN